MPLALVSCTTISVYVSFSKNLLPKGAHLSADRLLRGGYLSFAGAKVQLFHILAKYSRLFFTIQSLFLTYTLYIIYARVKGKGGKRRIRRGNGRKGITARENLAAL